MNRLFFVLQRRLAYVSREAISGVGLLVLCLVFYFFALRPTEIRLVRLQAQVAALTATRTAKTAQIDQDTPAEQLDAYYRFFPAQDSTPTWLAKIYQAARDHNIKLEHGEYRPAYEKSGSLVRYRITLPVKGAYGPLREFVATVLHDVPMASLDHISFERQKIGNQTIDAKIKLTLYLNP